MALVPEKWLAAARGLDRPRREGLIVAAGVLLGLLVMPLAIWLAGLAALGPYANGGFWALLGDFVRGLAEGSLACWIVLAGPYLFFSLFRLLRLALQRIAQRA